MQHSAIPIISLAPAAPVPLTDRWGEYIPRDIFKKRWGLHGSAAQAYENLRGHYDQGEMDPEGNPLYDGCSNGDPRNHLHREISFVAVHGGEVGILVEVELLSTFNEGVVLDNEYDDSELSPDDFTRLAATLQARLAELAPRYPHTQFFITHGDEVTFEGRVTVNAFTPLLDGMLPGGFRLAPEYKMLMVSPYFVACEGADITACHTLYRIALDLENCVSDQRGLERGDAA